MKSTILFFFFLSFQSIAGYRYHFKHTNLVLSDTYQLSSSSSGGGLSFLEGKVTITAQVYPSLKASDYIKNLKLNNEVSISEQKLISLSGVKGISFSENKARDYSKLKKVFELQDSLTVVELSCYLGDKSKCAAFAYLLDHLRWK